MLDQNQSRVTVTLNQDNKKVKKQIQKIYNEKLGKYETVLIEVPVLPISEQIEILKKETNQNSEIIKKLQTQRENLNQQAEELQKLVMDKESQNKQDEKVRINNQKRMIKTKQIEFQTQTLTEKEVKDRCAELDEEIKNANNYAKVLRKDLDNATVQNEDIKVLDQISKFNNDIEFYQNELKSAKQEYRAIEKRKKELEKQIDNINNGKDESLQLTQLTSEINPLKDKLHKLKKQIGEDDKSYNEHEIKINKYKEKYEENCLQMEREPKELKQEYLEIDLQEEIVKLDLENQLKEKKDKIIEKIKKRQERKLKLKEQLALHKPKTVKQLLEEKEDPTKLEQKQENFIKLYNQLTITKAQFDKQVKLQLKEQLILDKKLNDAKMKVITINQKMKEKDRERELAENKFQEIETLPKPKPVVLTPIPAESIKRSAPVSVPPVKVTEAKDLLQKKKEQLEKNKEKLLKKKNFAQQVPFEFAQKQDRKIKNKEETVLQKILDCQFRVSKRLWFGIEPTENTQIRDDVSVFGSTSIGHRIHKITFYHSPKDGLIYGFEAQYLKEIKADKQSVVTGKWLINQEMINHKDTQTDIIDLGVQDRIREVIIRRENNFVSFIQLTTKQQKVIKIGRELIEKVDDQKQEKQAEDKEKEGEQKKVEKPQDPDLFTYKVSKQQVLITLFGGLNQKSSEKELALSFFGFELASKLDTQEKQQLRELKQKMLEVKERERKQKLLEESMVSLKGQ